MNFVDTTASQSIIINLYKPIDNKGNKPVDKDSQASALSKTDGRIAPNKKMSPDEVANVVNGVFGSHKGMFRMTTRDAVSFLLSGKNTINLSDESQITSALLALQECKKYGSDVKVEVTFNAEGMSIIVRKDDGKGNPNHVEDRLSMSYEELAFSKDGKMDDKSVGTLKGKLDKKIDDKIAKKEYVNIKNLSGHEHMTVIAKNSFLRDMIRNLIGDVNSAKNEIKDNLQKAEDSKKKEEKNYEKKLDEKIVEKKQLLRKLDTLLQGIKSLKDAKDSPSFYENVAVLVKSRNELGNPNYDKKDYIGRAIEKARFGLVQLIDVLNKEARGKSVNLK